MPDTATYLDRIRSRAAGKDPLSAQEDTAAVIAALIEGVPDDQLQRRPAPQKWSILEIVAHLAEDELVTSWRYRQMLESPGCLLAGFDQDLWERLGNYRSWQMAEAQGQTGPQPVVFTNPKGAGVAGYDPERNYLGAI